jgi:hypothetical protein
MMISRFKAETVRYIMAKTMTQVKFTIEADIVAAFKARCAAEGISMTSAIQKGMDTRTTVRGVEIFTSTRPHRRKAVQNIIASLNGIMDSESEYRDSIPEQFAQRIENAEHACEMIAEAINCLEEAF